MKKAYEFPKAEKMAFDYSDAVVASTVKQCTLVEEVTDSGASIIGGHCGTRYTGIFHWSGDQA